jgi:hypothetical protein
MLIRPVILISLRLLFCLSICSPVWSKSRLSQNNRKGQTSDLIWVNQLQLVYESQVFDVFWPYLDQEAVQSAQSIQFEHLEVVGSNTSMASYLLKGAQHYRLSDQQSLMFSLGGYHMDHYSQSTQSQAHFATGYKLNWSEVFYLNISAERGYLFSSIIPLSGTPDIFYGNQINHHATYRINPDWDLSLRQTFIFYGDGNQSNKHDLQLMYAVMRFPHWILVGLGAEHLSYQDNQSPHYWSPRIFRSWGPRLDLSLNIIDSLNYFIGGSYNFFQEEAFSPGDGFFARTGVVWGDRNDWQLLCYYEKNQSVQNGNIWSNDTLSINFDYLW